MPLFRLDILRPRHARTPPDALLARIPLTSRFADISLTSRFADISLTPRLARQSCFIPRSPHVRIVIAFPLDLQVRRYLFVPRRRSASRRWSLIEVHARSSLFFIVEGVAKVFPALVVDLLALVLFVGDGFLVA